MEWNMAKEITLVFGYNDYGLEIARNISSRHEKVIIYSLEEHQKHDEQFELQTFDLSDNWDDLQAAYNMDEIVVFCALRDEASNIFLTISLHAAFPNTTIIALAKNKEDQNKLHMAGATKVIPIVETTANIIADMIKKPIITDVLHELLYEDSSLKLMQVEIHNAHHFDQKYPADINWSRDHGILVLSILHPTTGKHEFIYSSKAKHHHIENGDILIVAGYEKDIENFKQFLGESDE